MLYCSRFSAACSDLPSEFKLRHYRSPRAPLSRTYIMSLVKRYVVWGICGVLIFAAMVAGLGWLIARAPRNDSQAADEHSHLGISLMQRHLYHAAINEFEAATRQSPRALDPWVGLAAIYIRLGDGPKALEEAGKAATLAKDSADVQLVLGRAHWLSRNFSDAEAAALKVDELDPSNLQAAELLLHVYFDRKDNAKFSAVLEKIKDPNRQIQDLAVQYAVRQGEFRRANELRDSFDRADLESESLRIQLALKREPNRIESYPSLIRNLVRLGRVEEAIAVRGDYHGNTPLDLEMGKAHWLAGSKEEAIRAFMRASSGRTHKLSAEAALAAITGERRHWLEAFRAEWVEKDYFVLAQTEDLLKTASPVDRAFVYRYAGLFDEELFNDAAREALASLDSEPDNFDALMTLGTAYLRLGRVDDALRYVRQGADKHPERAEVWSRLGQLALAKSDADLAEQSMMRAAKMEPSNASYLYNYGWFLDQTDRDSEAAAYYERAIAASSLSFEAMNNLALIESARGNNRRALDLLDQAIGSNPENEAAYLNRANYHAMLRRWREALADYARVLNINPMNVYANVESARTHLELNRADIAIEELNAALDVEAHTHDAYVLLSTAYEKQGRKTDAAAALDEARRVEEPR